MDDEHLGLDWSVFYNLPPHTCSLNSTISICILCKHVFRTRAVDITCLPNPNVGPSLRMQPVRGMNDESVCLRLDQSGWKRLSFESVFRVCSLFSDFCLFVLFSIAILWLAVRFDVTWLDTGHVTIPNRQFLFLVLVLVACLQRVRSILVWLAWLDCRQIMLDAM